MITPEELDYIRTAAIGDMLGDSRAFDEMGASTVIFRLCVEIKKLRKERNENRALIRFIIGRWELEHAQNEKTELQEVVVRIYKALKG